MLRQALSCAAIGGPAKAARQLNDFVERTGADELMVTSQIFDHRARLRSYELLMEAVRQPEPALAK
jgi:alkanesulfonate monooxygenase SsuD/methylene tetrahydromethanopterin reductase-like flavin-dependent oxidoreductase (luciferase family)